MGHIFIVTTGLTGILNASFEMARRLQLAGHEVTLGAPRPVGERVQLENLPFVELPEILVDPVPATFGGGRLRRTWLRFRDRKARRRRALEHYRSAGFLAELAALQPDLTLIDVELHEYIITAYGNDYSFALLSQWYSLWDRPGLPYLLTDVIPGVGERGQPAAIRQHWEAVRQQRKRMFRKMALLSFGTDRRSTLLALARENDFPLETIRENYWPGVFTYDRFPVITMTPLELEFPHDPRPNLHYVGPMVHENRVEPSAVSHGGKSVDELLEIRAASGAQLILCTLSTMKSGDADFLRRLLAAAAERPDWLLIIGLGGQGDPAALGEIPPNVHTFGFVPQLKVLREADLSINHAGIHTIHECIHFGVPMLIYSGKESDQPGCAARVHYHGLGLMADKDQDDVFTIRQNIARVLEEPAYRLAVAEMQETIGHYTNEQSLEKLVSELAVSQTKKQRT